MNRTTPTSRREAPGPINWQNLQDRLAAARHSIEKALDPASEDTDRILRVRAEALAKEPTAEKAQADSIEVVEFMLAHERYALETRFVREVYPLEVLTKVPCVPPFVLGIVNVRGAVLSILDLRVFFDLPGKGLTDLNKVVVLEEGDMVFGILADAIVGVRDLAVADLQESLPTLTEVRAEYLRGVTRDRTVVLAAEKLLAEGAITVNDVVIV